MAEIISCLRKYENNNTRIARNYAEEAEDDIF